MVVFLCGIAETVMEMWIEVGLFVELCGKEKIRGKWATIASGCVGLVNFIIGVIINIRVLHDLTNTIILRIPLLGLCLGILMCGELLRAIIWSIFVYGTQLLLRLPIVIICAIIYGFDYNESVSNNFIWTKIGILFIYIIMNIIYLLKKKVITNSINMLQNQKSILFVIGLMEAAIVIYVINVDWEIGYSIDTLVLMMALIIVLLLITICIAVVLRYQMTLKINKLLITNERKMKADYEVLRNEMVRINKLNHDKRYEIEMLRQYILDRDDKTKFTYIQEQSILYNNVQKNGTWTGFFMIDYLIDKMIQNCEEGNVIVKTEITFASIPIEEYDFFRVLANLFENAVEAVMKCEYSNRFIALKMQSFNNNFRLYIENGYIEEPKKIGDKFISRKREEKEHGWGIENVKEIVEKYNGDMKIEYQDKKFIVDIMFMN